MTRQPHNVKFGRGIRIVAVAMMSFATPLIAAFVHSYFVIQRGSRLYNAEIGLNNAAIGRLSEVPLLWLTFTVLAGITFAVVYPFGRTPLLRWSIWLCFIAVWTFLLF